MVMRRLPLRRLPLRSPGRLVYYDEFLLTEINCRGRTISTLVPSSMALMVGRQRTCAAGSLIARQHGPLSQPDVA